MEGHWKFLGGGWGGGGSLEAKFLEANRFFKVEPTLIPSIPFLIEKRNLSGELC